jgi:hypothetical protein
MKPTRRFILTGGSAALVAPLLPHDAVVDGAIVGWHDQPLDEYTKLHDAAINGSYRLLSLSVYGPTSAPFYAAVMIQRAQPGEQHHFPSLTSAQLTQTLANQAAQNFGATIVAATGSASDPRFALVSPPRRPRAICRSACKRPERVSIRRGSQRCSSNAKRRSKELSPQPAQAKIQISTTSSSNS